MLRNSVTGFQIPVSRFQIPVSRFQIPVSRFRIPETQDIRYQNPRSGPTEERRPDPDQDTRFQAPAGRASALLPADAQKPDPAVAKATLGAKGAPTPTRIPDFRLRPAGPAPPAGRCPETRSRGRKGGPRGQEGRGSPPRTRVRAPEPPRRRQREGQARRFRSPGRAKRGGRQRGRGGRPDTGVISTNERNPGNRP